MESQQFHLKWNNHHSNVFSSFRRLFDSSCLVDVNLSCSNGQLLSAHRIVLASCSEFFEALFKNLPDKFPVIVLKDATEEIIRDLLEFMYNGEVEVADSNLADFLKFAETLKVKGLSQNASKDAFNSNTESESVINSDEEDLKATTKLSSEINRNVFSSIAQMSNIPNFFNNMHETNELISQMSSPALYNALKRKITKWPNQSIQKASKIESDLFLQNSIENEKDLEHPLPIEENGCLPGESDMNFLNSSSEQVCSIISSNSQGKGSRLQRMMEAEYKVMSEFTENTSADGLPMVTPELMKSRRTHSLQLAIAELLNSNASVQQAALKYQIPRETLRRHYQRYLKTVGSSDQKQESHSKKEICYSPDETNGMVGLDVSNNVGMWGIDGRQDSDLSRESKSDETELESFESNSCYQPVS